MNNCWNFFERNYIALVHMNRVLKAHRNFISVARTIEKNNKINEMLLEKCKSDKLYIYEGCDPEKEYEIPNNTLMETLIMSFKNAVLLIDEHIIIPIFFNAERKSLNGPGWYFIDVYRNKMMYYCKCSDSILEKINFLGLKYGICYVGDIEKAVVLYKARAYIEICELVGWLDNSVKNALKKRNIECTDLVLNNDIILSELKLDPTKACLIDNIFI